MRLPPAPSSIIDAGGQPAIGRHAGFTGPVDWARLAPPLARSRWWRRFHHKRWHYVALATGDWFCAVAIVHLGWTSTAFAYAFDRRARKLAASYAQDGVPGLSAGLAEHALGASRFRFLGSRIALCGAADGSFQLALRCPGFEIDARFGGGTAPLLAVGTVAGGAVHATQKTAGMAVDGELRLGAVRHALAGGVASVDYSNGLLARDTDWRWACGHSLALGFNLQAGYFGGHENALWLEGQPIALGAASFGFDRANPLAPWHVHTDDGLLELVFMPEGVRSADKQLLVAASRYVQPIGTFSGWVRAAPGAPKVSVSNLPGVTEDHHSRW